jgi:hypothetical protein
MPKYKVSHKYGENQEDVREYEIEASDIVEVAGIVLEREGFSVTLLDEPKPETPKSRIEDWALAIKAHEGWITPEDKNPKYPTGTASYRNNNPGNFRCYQLVMGEFGAIGCINNLAVFQTYEQGFNSLKQFLIYACTNELRNYKSTMSLLDFYKKYAPSSDGNNPMNYATDVARRLGVSIDTKIGDLYVAGSVEPDDTVEIKIEDQLSFGDIRFGNTKLKITMYGCKFLCVKYLYEKKIGKKISIGELDAKLLAGNCYSGNSMLDDGAIARTLGFEYLGKETDINNAPDWYPTIKEVDFSEKAGKQQHFVIRENINGKNVILDPYGGVERKINYYELKCGTPLWEKGGFSYRKFKI